MTIRRTQIYRIISLDYTVIVLKAKWMILWYQYKKQNWAVFPSPINPSYLIIGPPSSTKFMLFIDAKSRFNDTKFAYRNPTSLVPILRKSTCKFTMALPFFPIFQLFVFCLLFVFVCLFSFFCLCVSVLFCIVFCFVKIDGSPAHSIYKSS